MVKQSFSILMKTKILTALILVFSVSFAAFCQQEDLQKIRNLPLIITNASVVDNDAPIAFFISGDGGWYHFEQTIADNLAKKGIPTIGLDIRKYLWKRHTPE
jgi:type IV secretory pathway VirJ component